jgi:hypothetical protein
MTIEKKMFCNFFDYYEQSMEKSKLIVNYYNNICQGWHEWWWTMSMITQRKGKFKKVITIDMVQKKLC